MSQICPCDGGTAVGENSTVSEGQTPPHSCLVASHASSPPSTTLFSILTHGPFMPSLLILVVHSHSSFISLMTIWAFGCFCFLCSGSHCREQQKVSIIQVALCWKTHKKAHAGKHFKHLVDHERVLFLVLVSRVLTSSVVMLLLQEGDMNVLSGLYHVAGTPSQPSGWSPRQTGTGQNVTTLP